MRSPPFVIITPPKRWLFLDQRDPAIDRVQLDLPAAAADRAGHVRTHVLVFGHRDPEVVAQVPVDRLGFDVRRNPGRQPQRGEALCSSPAARVPVPAAAGMSRSRLSACSGSGARAYLPGAPRVDTRHSHIMRYTSHREVGSGHCRQCYGTGHIGSTSTATNRTNRHTCTSTGMISRPSSG